MTDPLHPPARLPRRFVLKAAGGAVLALPVLPSLLTPAEARAAEATNRRCFVQFISQHGGVYTANMFPADGALTEAVTYATAGHTVRRGALPLTVEAGLASVSPVLTASSSRLTASLAAKMNLLRGLDITYPIAHHYGGATMGNLAHNSSSGGIGLEMSNHPRRTIDQVMAWSPAFYPDLSMVRSRALTILQNSPISFNYANPETRSGEIQGVGVSWMSDSLALFDSLFPQPEEQPRAPIVDRVLESYRRLRNGNRRLSENDKRRLDEHMQRISELQRRLNAGAGCAMTRPTEGNGPLLESGYDGDPTKHVRYFQLLNDVVAAALTCGVTRVAAICGDAYNNTFSTVSSAEWHNDVAHQVDTRQDVMVDAQRRFFSEVVLDLASKLEAVDNGDGTTMLDRTLLTWAQEHGHLTHETFSIPVVTFGGAEGTIRTGSYCDYRNRAKAYWPSDSDEGRHTAPGLTWHQWLGTCLQAMGVPRTEYQEPDHNGYGKRVANTETWFTYDGPQSWPEPVWTAAGEVLPFLQT